MHYKILRVRLATQSGAILGFRRDVNEVFVLLGCYAA